PSAATANPDGTALVTLAGTAANSNNVRSALEGLAGGPGTVTVAGKGTTGAPWIITFTTPGNVAQLTTADTGLQRAQNSANTVTQGAGAAKEVQTITVTPAGDGTLGGEFKLTLGAKTSSALPYNA